MLTPRSGLAGDSSGWASTCFVELAALERREGDGALHLQSEVTRLREAAGEAVTGMREAQEECRWLHEQLRVSRRPVRRRRRPAPAAHLPERAAAASGGGGTGDRAAAACHGRGSAPSCGRGRALRDALQRGYVQAVNRVHELQRHFARLCEHQGTLRPQLAGRLERLAAQRLDNHALRARVARAEAAAVAGEPTAAAVVTAAAAGAQGDEPRRAPRHSRRSSRPSAPGCGSGARTCGGTARGGRRDARAAD